MKSFFSILSRAALVAGAMWVSQADAQQVQQLNRPAPVGDYSSGVPRKSVRAVMKDSPTIVPVVDSNAILNLDYNELRATPAQQPKQVVPVVEHKPAEPTLAELKLQLKNAEQNYKAANLEYTQAKRSQDKTRVAKAVENRNAAKLKVAEIKKAIVAKEPAKQKRAATKKRTAGKQRNAATQAAAK